MEKKKVEIIVGKKPTGPVDKSKVFKTLEASPGAKSVGGREMVYEQVECPICYRWSWIWYDTEAYHSYECCWCHNDFVV